MAIVLPILYKDDPKGLATAQKRLKKFAGNIGKITAGGFAVATVAAGKFAIDSVKAFADAEASQAKLSFAFEKFPKLADTNRKSLQKLNTALAKKTRFDDDAIAVGQATLAQYKLTGKQIKKLTPLIADYAARTGRSFEDSAAIVGKAMLGQGRALKDVGINFQDTGTLAGNFDQVVGKLGETVGGFAEKDVQTASGRLENLKNRFGEVQESIGEKLLPIFVELMEYFEKSILPKLDTFVTFVGDEIVPELKNFRDWVVKNIDVLGPAAVAVGILTGAVVLLNLAMSANPISLVIIAIAAVIALIAIMIANWDTIVATVKAAARQIASFFLGLILGVNKFIQDGANAVIRNFLNPMIEAINIVLGLFGIKKLSLIASLDLTSTITKLQDQVEASGGGRSSSGGSSGSSGGGGGGGGSGGGFARGGLITGRQRVLVGEGGPEVIAPYDRFIETLGMGSGGGGSTYNVTVNAGMGADGVSVGREIVKAIKRYERASGPVFAGA